MLTYVVYFAVACFTGLVVLGHILLLQALLTPLNNTRGKPESSKPTRRTRRHFGLGQHQRS